MQITLIAAVAANGVIGREGDLPWRLPDDLRRFQRVTRGHQVVMGRRTYESMDGPLPDRRNIVVTRNQGYRAAEGVLVVHSLDEAVDAATRDASSPDETLFILGGGTIYREALPRADWLDLTRVEAEVPGDTTFPDVDWDRWELAWSEPHPADDRHAHPFRFERWRRVRPD